MALSALMYELYKLCPEAVLEATADPCRMTYFVKWNGKSVEVDYFCLVSENTKELAASVWAQLNRPDVEEF